MKRGICDVCEEYPTDELCENAYCINSITDENRRTLRAYGYYTDAEMSIALGLLYLHYPPYIPNSFEEKVVWMRFCRDLVKGAFDIGERICLNGNWFEAVVPSDYP